MAFRRRVLFQVIAFLWGTGFASANSGVTYHGRLLRSDNTPVAASVVQFKIQVRTPGPENCLLYSEVHTLDMSGSEGVFAITINDGTATTVNTEPFTLDRAFQNRGTFSFGGGKCAIGNSYVPNASDGRKLVVAFNDGTFAGFESLPAQAINFVPMAMEAMTVGGYGSGSLLRVHDGTGAPASISALTQVQYNNFLDLLAGTSPLYLTSTSSLNGSNLSAGSIDDTKLASGISGTKISGNIAGNAAGFTGSLNGDVTGPQSATVVGKIQGRSVDSAAPANGQVLKWNAGNSRWEPAADNAGSNGTVTSVAGTGSIVMSGTATDPIVGVQDATTAVKGVVQLSANGGTTAGQVVQASDTRLSDARTPTTHHHGVDEIDSAVGKYFSYQPNNVACANGELLKWNSAQTRWECGTASSSESTTASNIGTSGVGVFKQLSTFDLQFKKLNAASSALSLTDDTVNNKIDIGVNAELGGLAGLSSNGFVKRTGAGTYSAAGSINESDLNNAGSMAVNAGVLVTDGTQVYKQTCSGNQVLIWTVANGWVCSNAVLSESDPKVGANTTNYLSKWNGSALVASGVFDNGTNVGIGSASPSEKLDVSGRIKGTELCIATDCRSSWPTGGVSGSVTTPYATSSGLVSIPTGVVNTVSTNGGATDGIGSFATFTTTNGTPQSQKAYIGAVSSSGVSAPIVLGQSTSLSSYVERMRIDSVGNVGIGTSNPNSNLVVAASTSPVLNLQNADGNGGTGGVLRFGDSQAGASVASAQIYASKTCGGACQSADLKFQTASGNAIADRMTITSAGSVGIGTTAPRAPLDVFGGSAIGKPAVVNGTSTVDFSTGNTQYTASNCGAFQLNNLKDGGVYSFVVKGATSTTCSFASYGDAGVTLLTTHLPPDHGATVTGKHTFYTLSVVGNDVYVAWTPGY